MYRHLDKLLALAKKKMRTEFNRFVSFGFDELNVINTKKVTGELFDRLMRDNEEMYLLAAKNAYSKAVKSAKREGYSGEEDVIDGTLVAAVLTGYNAVTSYLYDKEADRKRMRLNEQILTAREYSDRQLYNYSLRRTANLWWTQTSQYGIDMVDAATLKGYKDMGVKYVRWNAADDDRTCEICNERDGKIYTVKTVPSKPHYGCRCYVTPVRNEEE